MSQPTKSVKVHEVLIIGGGPGGSTAAAVLAKNSVDVAIVEREPFPRFHIGESLLPASMVVFKETGFYETLSSGKYIEKYGARFVDYKTGDEIYFGFNDSLNPDIPMAFEVERRHFDQDILDHAVRSGATLYQPETVTAIEDNEAGVTVTTNRQTLRGKYLIDVSGRDSVIGKKLQIRRVNKDNNNFAVFAHFKNVERQPGKSAGDIIIGLLPERAWTWIIPFKGEVTSVGVVSSSNLFNGRKDLGSYIEERLASSGLARNYMKNARRVSEIQTIGNYSHTCETFFGDRWILAGDAALFLDPIFSSGVHMSVSSAKRAAEVILKILPENGSFKGSGRGKEYEDYVRLGASRFRSLIRLFYKGEFVEQMKKTITRDNVRKGFTSAVAGDVWDERNFLFERSVL